MLVLLYGLLFVLVAAFADYLFERRLFEPVFLGLAFGSTLYVALGLILPGAFPQGLLAWNREARVVLGIALGVALILLVALFYGRSILGFAGW